MSPKISIVVLNYNGLEDTRECIQSLEKIVYDNYDVLVIDNGSQKNEAEPLRKEFRWIGVIRNENNLGFAGGNNQGMRYALEKKAEYILLLNNDTIVDPGILNQFLKAAAEHPQAGFFSAKVYFFSERNKIWFVGARFDDRTAQMIHHDYGSIDDGIRFNEVRPTAYANGCALFIRKETIEKVGLMDERFFLLYEETDWCYKGARAGYGSIMVPQAKVWHKASVSFSGMNSPLYDYYFTRNRFLWYQRNLCGFKRLRAYFLMCFRIFMPHLWHRKDISLFKRIYWDFLYHKRARSNYTSYARLIGLRDFILRRFGECPRVIYEVQKKYKESIRMVS